MSYNVIPHCSFEYKTVTKEGFIRGENEFNLWFIQWFWETWITSWDFFIWQRLVSEKYDEWWGFPRTQKVGKNWLPWGSRVHKHTNKEMNVILFHFKEKMKSSLLGAICCFNRNRGYKWRFHQYVYNICGWLPDWMYHYVFSAHSICAQASSEWKMSQFQVELW